MLHGFFVLGLVAANPVTWSLSYEVVFYAFVPLLAWRLRGRRPVPGLAWFVPLALAYAALVALSMALPQPKAIYLAYFALFLPGVALGALAPEVRARIAGRTPFFLVLCAWIGFTVAVKLEWVSNLLPAYYPLSSLACALVLLKACDERHAFARWLATPALCRLGKISYSFFLIHYAVVHVYGGQLAHAIGLEHRLRFTLLFIPGAFVLSVLAAALLYLAAERFYFRLP